MPLPDHQADGLVDHRPRRHGRTQLLGQLHLVGKADRGRQHQGNLCGEQPRQRDVGFGIEGVGGVGVEVEGTDVLLPHVQRQRQDAAGTGRARHRRVPAPAGLLIQIGAGHDGVRSHGLQARSGVALVLELVEPGRKLIRSGHRERPTVRAQGDPAADGAGQGVGRDPGGLGEHVLHVVVDQQELGQLREPLGDEAVGPACRRCGGSVGIGVVHRYDPFLGCCLAQVGLRRERSAEQLCAHERLSILPVCPGMPRVYPVRAVRSAVGAARSPRL